VTAEGAAYCRGANENGQLGDGTTTNRTTPVLAAAGMSLARLDVGVNHVCAVTRDAATVCWGAGSNRQLGRDGPFAP